MFRKKKKKEKKAPSLPKEKYKVEENKSVPLPPKSPSTTIGKSKSLLPPSSEQAQSKAETAAVVVQRNIRGHLSRKENEEVQSQLRKAKYLRSKGWDRPPSPIVTEKKNTEETQGRLGNVEQTPVDISRTQELMEEIRKLTLEKDALLNKNKKLRTILTNTKRKSSKAEADLLRANRKNKDMENEMTNLKKKYTSTGKAKRESDLNYLKLEKQLEESIKEKAELILELDKMTKGRDKVMRMHKMAEKEVEKLQQVNTSNNRSNRNKRRGNNQAPPNNNHSIQKREERYGRDINMEHNNNDRSGDAIERSMNVNTNDSNVHITNSDSKNGNAYLQIAIQNLKDELEVTLRDKIRAEQGFKQAMQLCNARSKELNKIKQLVNTVANELPADNDNPMTYNQSNVQQRHYQNNNNTIQYHNNNMQQFEQEASTPIRSTNTHSKETTPQRHGSKPRNEKFKSTKDVEKRTQRQKVERRNMELLRRRSLIGSGNNSRNRLPNL